MARLDDIGLFWEDLPPVKPPKKEKPKRTPPERTWEHPDYLPNLKEALAFKIDLLEDWELPSIRGDKMILDEECYPNYYLAAFRHVKSGKITYVEMYDGCPLDIPKFKWLLQNFCIVTFNGIHYDLPMAAMALAGKTNLQLYRATQDIIEFDIKPHEVLRQAKVKKLKDQPFVLKGVRYPREVNHIDLKEVAKGDCSLKIYSGRMHCVRMQDLPFVPGTMLSPNQIIITRWYCCNDLINTQALLETLDEQMALRETLSEEYGKDVRSKSDAQIAETLLSQMVGQLNKEYPQIPIIEPGTVYKFQIPTFVRYHSALLQWMLEVVRNAEFVINENGSPIAPPEIKALSFKIADKSYQMGLGGLHSQEETICHVAGPDEELIDIDVASYYPKVILSQGIYPVHLGPNFLKAYESFVKRRLAAKAAKNKPVAESLKIVVNGGFGKLGSMYSILYAPNLMLQVTLTGQLALLMLIERLEIVGIPVVSANTDGTVVKCQRNRREEFKAIVKQWEFETQFELEETLYSAIYNRDVNAYIAVKIDGTVKTKGPFGNPWIDTKNIALRLEKNPAATICTEAVTEFLTKGTPVEQTIRLCDDVRKFVSIRQVKGGAVKDGEYLGKAVRWYYANNVEGEIIYALTGNIVSRSTGAKPLMLLPALLPDDINYDWYVKEAENILINIGHTRRD